MKPFLEYPGSTSREIQIVSFAYIYSAMIENGTINYAINGKLCMNKNQFHFSLFNLANKYALLA